MAGSLGHALHQQKNVANEKFRHLSLIQNYKQFQLGRCLDGTDHLIK